MCSSRLALVILIHLLYLSYPSASEAHAELDSGLSQLRPPPQLPEGLVAAEVVELPDDYQPPEPPGYPDNPSSYRGPKVAGYKLVLSGQLDKDLTLSAENTPALVRGMLIVPAGRTLLLKNGARLYLQPDLHGKTPNVEGAPDPTANGMLWIYGRLLSDGLSAGRVALHGAGPSGAGLFFYGEEASELRGADLHDTATTQASGTVQWLGCTFNRCAHYALARGAGLFVHCDFKRCGGVLATYDAGPWSLLVKRCQFEGGNEGLVLGSDPGIERLIVEQNHFEKLAGAHLRAMPVEKGRPLELLIGENWHGTSAPEEFDARIVDRRSNPRLSARINTRPPAEGPYAAVGAGAPMQDLARTYQELAAARQTLLAAQRAKSKLWSQRKTTAQKP